MALPFAEGCAPEEQTAAAFLRAFATATATGIEYALSRLHEIGPIVNT